MRCPRCKTLQDILLYVPMEEIEEFAEETTPCYKCPKCRWIFAPAPTLQELLAAVFAEPQGERPQKMEVQVA